MPAGGASEVDVVVVGGGPAGSTVATLTALRGARVLLLERETFPRYQIGESLLPATVHGICRLLGVDEEVEKAGFVRKLGGTFRWGSNPAPWTFHFAASPRFPGPTSYAFQVERMRFDAILLDNARRHGVDVRQQCTVTDVERRDDGAVVRFVDKSANPRTVDTPVVVDASGNRSRVYRRVGGERRYSEFFRNIAVFGYFNGGGRLPEPRSGNIFCAAFDDGWFWYIPLSADLTSVGAVVHQSQRGRVQGNPTRVLAELIERCAPVRDLLRDATRVTDGPYGEVRLRKDYSYCHTRFWSPGMALVGDAACFVDPVFSSGVHLATYGALLAARSINSLRERSLDEATAFAEFERRYRAEYGRFHEFLTAFYDVHEDEQSYFWSARKVTAASGSDLAAFAELVGGGASGDATLHAAGTRQVRRAAEELTAAVGHGGDGDRNPLLEAPVVARVMRESSRLQAGVSLPDGFAEEPGAAGGLVPTADGLAWTTPTAV